MKKKLLIIGPVLLLVALVVVKMVVLKPAPPDERKLAKEPGLTYVMKDPFVVNLADGGGPHFAKVGVAMRFSKLSEGEIVKGEGDTPDTVEEAAELRDIVIATLQSKTSGELSSAEGRESVKRAIVQRVNRHTDYKIVEVYYTEFAVQ